MRASTGRLIGSLVATAITVAVGWLLVYHFAIKPLSAGGWDHLIKALSSPSPTDLKWWREFLGPAFDVLILIIAVIGSWWVLGHFALEASEAGKWSAYYRSEEGKGDRWIQKLGLWHRIQHMWVMITFALCAITGFALQLNLPVDRVTFVTAHVYSGLAMGVLVIIHFFQYLVEGLLTLASGKSLRERYPMLEFYSFRYFKTFFKDLLRTVSSKVKPEPHGKYDPEQLFEYWGIYWGMAVLGIPGLLILLYGNAFMGGVLWLMHVKEAVLAVTFIIMVHLAYTHFRPKVFPMDLTFITGKLPLKRIEEEHPRWAEALKE